MYKIGWREQAAVLCQVGSPLFCFFDPYAHIHDMFQRIFPHTIGYTEPVSTFFQSLRPLCRRNKDAVFENIIHTRAQPAFTISGQLQFQRFAGSNRIAGSLHTYINPDILIAISIRVPDHQVNVVKARSVFNIKADLRFELAAPGMIGDSNILFKNIYRSTGCNDEEAGNEEGKGQNMKLAVPFQWEIFLQI